MIILKIMSMIVAIAFLALIIGTFTVAATIGGGPLFGLLVLALLIGIASIPWQK